LRGVDAPPPLGRQVAVQVVAALQGVQDGVQARRRSWRTSRAVKARPLPLQRMSS
jgi:hypothetical protein